MNLWATTALSLTLSGASLTAQSVPPAPPVAVWNWQQSGSYIGVGVVDINERVAEQLKMNRPHGVEITYVTENSPAMDAGVKKGEVIISFRGQDIESVEQFARLVRETPVGREAPLTLVSKSGRRDVTITMGARGETAAMELRKRMERTAPLIAFDVPRTLMVTRSNALGATLEPVDGQLARFFGADAGVLVRDVDSGSPADDAGLLAGDFIVEVQKVKVARPSDVRREIARAGAEDQVQVTVLRNKSRKTVAVEAGRDERDQPLRTRSVRSPR